MSCYSNGAIYCAAAENQLPIVGNDSLARCDGPLRFIKYDAYLIPRQRVYGAGGLPLVIARAGKSPNRRIRFRDRKPVEGRSQEIMPVKRTFRADKKRVSYGVLSDHIAGLARGETKAAPLSDRIAEQALMPSDYFPVYREEMEKAFGQGSCFPIRLV